MKKNLLLKVLSVLILGTSAQADVVITVGGDVNFNRNRLQALPDGVSYGNSVTPFASFTTGIRPLLNGDLNFANIETVVTDTNDLSNEDKKFAFASHTNSIRHLLDIGFNFFSLANNHTYDYGQKGMERTHSEFSKLKNEYGQMVYHGIDDRKNVLVPRLFSINGIRIAFAAITIADSKFRATPDRKGILYIHSEADYKELTQNFKKTPADFKIMSIHYGTEGQVSLDGGQRKRYEYALDYGDVDLILGHHPHVVRPIQKNDKGMIFYSFGNYLMLGSADMTKRQNTNLDWGMFARLYLERDPQTGKVKVEATEVIPLTNTHTRTTPLQANQASIRVQGLNILGQQQLGNDSLYLNVDPLTGRGTYCDSNLNSIRAKILCSSNLSGLY